MKMWIAGLGAVLLFSSCGHHSASGSAKDQGLSPGASWSGKSGNAPVSIAGPNGVRLAVPPVSAESETSISLVPGSGAQLMQPEERLASPVVKIALGGRERLSADGFSKLNFPVTQEEARKNPDQLFANVKLPDGTLFPLRGVFDAQTGNLEIPLGVLVHGSEIAVVHAPQARLVTSPPRSSRGVHSVTSRVQGTAPRTGWITPMDWQTCEFAAVNTTQLSDEEVRTKILQPSREICEHLAAQGLRSPRLWIDSRLNPGARIIHVNNDASKFVSTPKELVPGFILDQTSEDTMLGLGQLLVSYKQWKNLNQKFGVSFGNIILHEMIHAVQYGYDIRMTTAEGTTSLRAYLEGTATPMGQTYEDQGTVAGPTVSVRDLREGEYMLLDSAVDDPRGPNYYRKQSFFAYLAKRYHSGSFGYLHQFLENLAMAAYDHVGASLDRMLEVHRAGLAQTLTSLFGKSLAEVYFEFAEDRAYVHSPFATLHAKDVDFKPYRLAEFLFSAKAGEEGIRDIDLLLGTTASQEFGSIPPLSMRVVRVLTPMETCIANCPEIIQVPLHFKVEGADFSASGVKIIGYREKLETRSSSARERFEVTSLEQPMVLTSPRSTSTPYTFLILNGSTENRVARVSVTAGAFIRSTRPRSGFTGQTIEVQGSGFGSAAKTGEGLFWGDTRVETQFWSDSVIRFAVPQDWTSGTRDLRIKADGRFSNASPFTVHASGKTQLLYVSFWEGRNNTLVATQLPLRISDSGQVTFDHTFTYFRYSGTEAVNCTLKGSGTYRNGKLDFSGTYAIQFRRVTEDEIHEENQSGWFEHAGGHYSLDIWFATDPSAQSGHIDLKISHPRLPNDTPWIRNEDYDPGFSVGEWIGNS